ncbi:DgyrCDS4908 [Dimorphilus gyrociliatus]|nr:DgyrCDS4908 [Dimorphilus gyrociliatus]
MESNSDFDNKSTIEQSTKEIIRTFAGKTAFKWDNYESSPNLEICNLGLTVKKCLSTDTADIARSTSGYTEGIHIFKVNWPKKKRGEVAIIGVSTDQVPVCRSQIVQIFDSNEVLLGWDIVNNQSFFNGNLIKNYPKDRNPNYAVPENFYMILDLDKGILAFRTDDEEFGFCYCELNSIFAEQGIKLYPVINLTSAGSEVTVVEIHNSSHDPSKRRIGMLLEMSVKWRMLNSMMIHKSSDKVNVILQIIQEFLELNFMVRDDLWMYKTYLKMMTKLDDTRALNLFQIFSLTQIRDSVGVQCFIAVSRLMYYYTWGNALFPIALVNQKCLDTIIDTFQIMPKLSIAQDVKSEILVNSIGLLHNLSKVTIIKDEIIRKRIHGILENYCDTIAYPPTVCLISVMTLGNVLYSDNRQAWIVPEKLLEILVELTIKAIKEGHAKFSTMYVFPREALETLLAILDCAENCHFLLKRNLIGILNDALIQLSNDNVCLELAQQCLNKLFTLIVMTHEGKDQQYRKIVKVNGLVDVLKKLDERDFNYLSMTSKICLYKIQKFTIGKIKGECILENLSRRFLKEYINIDNKSYLLNQYDKCYCPVCHSIRNEAEGVSHGIPPRYHSLPIGWFRFALKIPSQAKSERASETWHRAFHGTRVDRVYTILRQEELLLPGEMTADGHRIKELPGHYNNDNKPEGFNTKRIFVSPSLRYANYYSPGKQ